VNVSDTKLYVPDIRFNRKIGQFAGQYWAVDGRSLTQAEWEAYLPSVLPTSQDEKKVQELTKDSSWITPKGKD